MNTIPKDQRYTRIVVTPGKSYTCGCDYSPYKNTFTGEVIDKKTCPTHGQPVAPEKVQE
jgi:hypothetical protein